MRRSSLTSRRRLHAVAVAAVLAAVGGCGSSGTQPPLEPGQRRGTLVAPSDVAAVVLEISGATDVAMESGQAFSSSSANALRAVLVLDEPGTVTFTVALAEGAAEPVATVVEVSGPDGGVPASLTGYRVEFGGRE